MRKIISTLVLLFMLMGMLVSCSGGVDGTSPQDSGTENSSSEIEVKPSESIDESRVDDKGYLLDRLPEADYEGQSISILSWEGNEALTYPSEPGDGGDPIQHELYYHWRSVESRLGVSFRASYVDSSYPNMNGFMTTARAEDAAYDLIQTQCLFPSTLAQEGRLTNLRNLAYPDLEMPWWPESVEEWTQYGALFFVASNSSAGSISNLSVIFANIQMMEEEGLGDPVKLVLRGNWTIEELITYSKKFAGLAEANPGEIYGFYVDVESRTGKLFYAAGFNNTRNNANGVAELAIDNEETLQAISDVIDQYVILMSGVETEIGTDDDASPMYEGKTAMLLGFLQEIRLLEDTASYAALPLPKRDVDQQDYRILHRDWLDVWCVPISTADKELCGMILEATASSEYRNIAPFYFEQYLVKRYSTTAEGMKCFELLRESVVYDFAHVNGCDVIGIWRSCFYSGRKLPMNIFVSEYTSRRESLLLTLKNCLDNYKQYKDL